MTELVCGREFNPSRKKCGFYVPDAFSVHHGELPVSGNTDGKTVRKVTDGHKRLYERLVRWAGDRGYCWRSHRNISKHLGKSERQVKDDMKALAEFGLIEPRHRGKRRDGGTGGRAENEYHFLWSPILEQGKVLLTALNSGKGRVRSTALNSETDADESTGRLSAVEGGVECSGGSGRVQSTAQGVSSSKNCVPEFCTKPAVPDASLLRDATDTADAKRLTLEVIRRSKVRNPERLLTDIERALNGSDRWKEYWRDVRDNTGNPAGVDRGHFVAIAKRLSIESGASIRQTSVYDLRPRENPAGKCGTCGGGGIVTTDPITACSDCEIGRAIAKSIASGITPTIRPKIEAAHE